MAKYTREEVLAEAKDLASKLANIEEIDRFKEVEAKVNENEKVQRLISRIKALQKQAVNFQQYEKMEALKRVEADIDRVQEELDSIPVVQEFQEIQVLVNDVLQLVSGTIAREVTNHVIRDTDGDLLSGETGSKVKSKQASSSCCQDN